MLFAEFLSWWYGRGWLSTIDQAGNRMKIILEVFSIPILIKTLFAPWKQIVSISTTDQSLNDRISKTVDNVVSRFVGLAVRLVVLLTAIISMLVASVFGLAWIIIWPFLPLMIPILLIMSSGVF